jgi:hypothetical protein
LQIHGRAKNYPQLFNRDGSVVSLHNIVIAEKALATFQKFDNQVWPSVKTKSLNGSYPELIKLGLMNEDNFKRASEIDCSVPIGRCGLYCIRISDLISYQILSILLLVIVSITLYISELRQLA